MTDTVTAKLNGLKRMRYPYYLTKKIRENAILLEAQHGQSVDGTVFALLSVLAKEEEFRAYTLYLTVAKKKRKVIEARLKSAGLTRVKTVVRGSYRYFKVLATSKYLMNDTTFIFNFVKREGQVYLNTWHGTPLKTLGKSVKGEAHTIGNIQKNLLAADYLLFPNEFTMEHMVRDYMLENIGQGEVWLSGYPRNGVFFNKAERQRIRKRYELDGMTVYAFLPTWRGTVGNVADSSQTKVMEEQLAALDEGLPEKTVIYVKLHTFNGVMPDFTGFSQIRPFPTDCETYTFLNAADGLITDYSSVFFDYAVTGKKILLFAYDEEEYEAERGFYMSLSDLPFPRAKTVEELLTYIKQEKYYDDREFLKKFCSYERPDAAAAVCRKLLFGTDEGIKTCAIPDNGKRNVVVFGGGLYNNGISTSLFNLLSLVEKEKFNYTLLFKTEDIKGHPEALHVLPEGVNYLGFSNGLTLSLPELLLYKFWTKKGFVPYRMIRKIEDKIARWDAKRLFTGCRVDKLIHFSGYSNDVTTIFYGVSCNKTIYMHSDMEKEVEERRLIRKEVLARAYREYDNVAVVTEDIKPIAERIAEGYPFFTEKKACVTVAKNVIDYKRVLKCSEQTLAFDPTTRSNVSLECLREILASSGVKFVNVGRFSAEKGHARLLSAFDKIHKENPETYLILIGGRGELYEETMKKARELGSYDHIVLILFMSNPFPLLKQCDYFIFSSLYEGFGLVLAEADILGVRCVSTDIPGPRLFMQKYGGTLVENSEQGIYDGMKRCLLGKVTDTLSVDYEEYNKEAVAEFERIAAME